MGFISSNSNGLMTREHCSYGRGLNFRQAIIINQRLPVWMTFLPSKLVCRARLLRFDRARRVGRAPCPFLARRPFRHIEDCGIILNLTQTSIGCVAQAAIVGPAPEIDFGNQRWLSRRFLSKPAASAVRFCSGHVLSKRIDRKFSCWNWLCLFDVTSDPDRRSCRGSSTCQRGSDTLPSARPVRASLPRR
jgi:hypothetical protein